MLQSGGGGSGGGKPAVGILGTVRVWAGVAKAKAGTDQLFCGVPNAPGSSVGGVWWSGCRKGRPRVLCFMAVV